jgi:polysaccharide export outer membrane protein
MPLKTSVKPCRIKGVPFYISNSLKPMRKFFNVQCLSVILPLLLFCSLSFGQQVPVGPSSIPQYSDKPSSKDGQKEDKDRKSEGPSVGAAVDSNTYKVGPADVLMVKVWNEEKFSGQVVVQQNGNITLPLVGDVAAGQTTPKDIEVAVAKSLTKYVVKPLVTVTVMAVESKKYYLDGLVNHPGEYPLAVPTTILEAISKSGGLQDFANKKKIYILRGDKKIPFNLKDVMNGRNMDQNIHLEPGDHIVVP